VRSLARQCHIHQSISRMSLKNHRKALQALGILSVPVVGYVVVLQGFEIGSSDITLAGIAAAAVVLGVVSRATISVIGATVATVGFVMDFYNTDVAAVLVIAGIVVYIAGMFRHVQLQMAGGAIASRP
ncbi:MAG: hypothetical protein M8354_11050, partial [Halalkalicoccus sp.]|nr:hypothetical protein [Halalkalicoccus sp.]